VSWQRVVPPPRWVGIMRVVDDAPHAWFSVRVRLEAIVETKGFPLQMTNRVEAKPVRRLFIVLARSKHRDHLRRYFCGEPPG
jgi:hypothetical protein